jgi:hypothetical protein
VIRSEYMWVIHVDACVAINAKGGDCWQIQLTDSERNACH